MSKETLEQYRIYEQKLWEMRVHSLGQYSQHEDGIVEAMTEVWYQLTEKEQAELDAEGPQCFPSQAVIRYCALEQELLSSRQTHNSNEDTLLDTMDAAWYNMTTKDIQRLHTYKGINHVNHVINSNKR